MNNFNSSSRLPPVTHSPLGRTAGQTLRRTALVLSMLMWAGSSAMAQVSVGVSLPGVSIGINMPMYPQLVRVPNYPVYYAPQLRTNYFFYDGGYWVYQQDNWYTSSWYNGPWMLMAPRAVPLYVLRIPVRYYRNQPTYFRGWQPNAPPRWGEHWGNDWAQQRSGWDHWDRRAAPAPAPLPTYQRQYSGTRYPQADQQQALHSRNYRYQPRDAIVPQHVQQQVAPVAVGPSRAERSDPQVHVAPPGPEHSQRQGQEHGPNDSQARSHQQERDNEDGAGRQHKK